MAAILALSLLLLAGTSSADTITSLGERSGEGSTPFTGLAQAPEANLYTGSLATQVALELPPGRNGMQPKLALRYSSNGGPGPFGIGWKLPVGQIQRVTKWGVPRCRGDHVDDFILTMPDATVELINDPPGSDQYRPVFEESYLLVRKLPASNQWVVHDRNGLRYVFGATPSARAGSDIFTFMSEDANGYCRFTAAWALTHVEDRNGNSIDFGWYSIANVLYLADVQWGGNTQTGLAHFYRAAVEYELRPDFVESYRDGAPSILAFRAASIVVTTDVPTGQTSVRRYDLLYDPEGGSNDAYQSHLEAVQVTGYPATLFAYAGSTVGHESLAAPLASPGTISNLRDTNSSGDVKRTMLDMNGDGFVDIVRSDTGSLQWWVYLGGPYGDTWGFQPNEAERIVWTLPAGLPNTFIRSVKVGGCNQGQAYSCVVSDTFDITGDGVPDFVQDAGVGCQGHESCLKVYPGVAPDADGQGAGFAPFVWWPSPVRYLRQDDKRPGYSDVDHDILTYQDIIDVDGDGRPDLLVAPGDQAAPPYQWDVYLNTGFSFDSDATTPATLDRLPYFPAPSDYIQVQNLEDSGRGHVSAQLMDFNGDGLPDYVDNPIFGIDSRCDPVNLHASCLDVYANTGQGFAASPVTSPLWDVGSLRHWDTNGNTDKDVFDINGDGLPDRVGAYGNAQSGYGGWYVYLNQAGRLDQEGALDSITWPGVSGPIRKQTTGPSADTTIDLVDVNGDGMIDRIQAGSTTWTATVNISAVKPSLLVAMRNGLGSITDLRYKPSTVFENDGGDGVPDLPFVTWTVDGIRRSDGLCDPGDVDVFDPLTNPCIDDGHELIATFLYRDGRFDPDEREFRGFRNVLRISEEGHDQAGDPIEGNHTMTYFGQDTPTKGKVLRVDTYAGSTELVRYEDNLWATQTPTGAVHLQRWLIETQELTQDGQAAVPQALFTHYDPPDPYGNITHHYRYGLFGTYRVDTYTVYAEPVGSISPVYGLPAETRTEADGAVLERTWFHYDGATADGLPQGQVNRGNLKRVEKWLDTDPAASPQMRMAYDAYGNVVSVTDANGSTTLSSYSGDGHGKFLYPLTVTNELGHQTVTRMDYRWGKPTSMTDPNGAVTRYAYDDVGRRTCLVLPGDSLDDCTIAFEYDLATQPGQLSTLRTDRKQVGFPPLTTTQYFDALGRPRYSDTFQVVDGVGQTVRLNRVDYDAAGRVAVRYQPYLVSAPDPDNGATTFDFHLNGSTHLDPLGRIHETTFSDGNSRRTVYAGSLTTTYDEENEKTETTVDPYGRLALERVFDGNEEYASTRYTYDGLGRLLQTKQNGSVISTNTYDSLGRKIATTDADSGSWAYGYDANGNLIYQDDPRPDQHVQFCYDTLNRPTRRCMVDVDFLFMFPCDLACGEEVATYKYDDPAVPNSIGRLTHVVDESGETSFRVFDPRGRARAVTKAIDVEGKRTEATTVYSYDAADHLVSVRYPDGEVVFTDYDAGGRPVALRNGSGTSFVANVEYDLFGRMTKLEHGNGVIDTRTYHDYSSRHRLQGIRVARSGDVYLNLSYATYTPRGGLSEVVDLRYGSGALSDRSSLRYDHLARLLSASGPRYSRTYAYDPYGNIVRNGGRIFQYDDSQRPHQMTSVTSGSGTTTSVVYDENGNRISKDDGAQTYAYTMDGRLREMVMLDRAIRFVYDYGGNRVAQIDELSGAPSAATRYYSELVGTTAGGLAIKSYFLGGLRVASRRVENVDWELESDESAVRIAKGWIGHPAVVLLVGNRVQLAAGLTAFVVAAALLFAPWRRKPVVGVAVRHGHVVGVVLVFVLGTLPWPLAVAPARAQCGPLPTPTPLPAGKIVHYHVDHLGSTQVATDENGEVVEQIRYFPYGEVRGRWDGNGGAIGDPDPEGRHEFTGYETEIHSGLEYAGARFYDPTLASFLSQDPVHQFLSPYSYGGGDPMNWTDPDGEFFEELIVAAVISAVASAAVNAIVAGFQGASPSQVGEAALRGAATGAVGVGLGVVASAAGVAAGTLAGTVPASVGIADAAAALGEVAYRSAFSTTIANASGQVASAAGAPESIAILSSAAAGFAGSFIYDQVFLDPSGELAQVEGRGPFRNVSNKQTHADITSAAAAEAGFSPADMATITAENLARDKDIWANQDHFGSLAQETFEKLKDGAFRLRESSHHDAYLAKLGAASHHLQDQFALGHIVPGTHLLKGPLGAPFRFLIHQTFGGEVSFRQASYRASLRLFDRVRNSVGS